MGARDTKKTKESSRLKENKLHIRVSRKDKLLIEKAADLIGLNASTFVLENAIRAARRELAIVETLSLSKEDSEVFLKLISNPPTPNKVMNNAFDEYKKRIVNNL